MQCVSSPSHPVWHWQRWFQSRGRVYGQPLQYAGPRCRRFYREKVIAAEMLLALGDAGSAMLELIYMLPYRACYSGTHTSASTAIICSGCYTTKFMIKSYDYFHVKTKEWPKLSRASRQTGDEPCQLSIRTGTAASIDCQLVNHQFNSFIPSLVPSSSSTPSLSLLDTSSTLHNGRLHCTRRSNHSRCSRKQTHERGSSQ